ncbi:nudC domain-containing protein 1 [Planococcus citri]|uniref:nudC domain-containing protein 1 n=1 Tax=Planococcus citri TaxID=170843 RepID=UPI0031F8CCC9
MSHLVELRANKDLIDSNFEGYKLSLDQIPATNHELPSGVHKLEKIGDTFSYLYLVLFSTHNHLISDPWNENDIYYISEKRTVTKIELQTMTLDSNNTEMRELVEIPSFEAKEFGYNISLLFAGPSTAVISTGTGTLHVINTGIRNCSQNWTVESSLEVLSNPFTLLDARVKEQDSNELHCLLTSIVEKKDAESTIKVAKAYTELHWIVLKKSGEKWSIEDTFKFHSLGAVRCGYFPPGCEHLFIESNKPVELPSNVDPQSDTKQEQEQVEDENKEPEYYWQQTEDDIKIWFGLPAGCVKDDVKVHIENKRISVEIKDKVCLAGETFQRLDSDVTTWNITNNRLEIIVCKHEEGQMWQYLVQNTRGEELVDNELVKQVHERLAHLCSENEAVADDTTPAFNPGQLEACDNAPDEDSRLIVIDAKSKKLLKEANLTGHQKLFNIRLSDSSMGICVRHDVDGIVWKLEYDDEKFCHHTGTLNAFGYVLASKQWKYATCSPDFSYAVISATKQNLFIYKQNCSVVSDLRNRKTGHKFNQVGKQFLVSLNSTDEIVGVHVTRRYLFVLTKNLVSIYYIGNVE